MTNMRELTLPTDVFMRQISTLFHGFPPSMGNGVYPLPYTLDDIASLAVKTAAKIDPITGQPDYRFKEEMITYLTPFDPNIANDIANKTYEMIMHIIARFKLYNAYDISGESSYRFIGYANTYTNVYDISVKG